MVSKLAEDWERRIQEQSQSPTLELKIDDGGAPVLARHLRTNSTWTSLKLCGSFYGSGIKFGDKGASALALELETNKTVTVIDLSRNKIGDVGAKALARVLSVNSTVKTINLSHNDVGDEGAVALAGALQENSSITQIKLCKNSIGYKGAVALAGALERNSTVTDIGMSENKIGEIGVNALAHALRVNRTLQTVNLWHNDIGDEGAVALACALQENSSITRIPLDCNRVGDTGATALAGALERNSTVTDIGLSYNSIGDVGAKALAHALTVKCNCSVKNISLHYNHIGDEGAVALAGALQENTSIEHIDLGRNQIGDTGATALAGALERNSTVTDIDLSRNGVGDVGATALARALTVNRSVKSINPIDNKFGLDGYLALAASIMTQKTECTVRLSVLYQKDMEFLAKHGVIDYRAGNIAPTCKYPVGLNIRAILQKYGQRGVQLVDHRCFTRSNHDGSYCAVAAAAWNDVDKTLHFLRLWPERTDEVLLERYGSGDMLYNRYGSPNNLIKRGLLYDMLAKNQAEGTEAIEAAVAVAEAIKGTSALSLVNIHLCGEGYAGKTMTRQALLETLNCGALESFKFLVSPNLPDVEGRTLGMECEAIEFTGSDGAPVRALLHDYGGQLEFRANHAPHLSAPNSVYVIVVPLWDKRPDHDRSYELEDIVAMYTQWLKFLYTVVPTVAADKKLQSPAALPQCLTVINFARLCTAATVRKVQLRLMEVLDAFNAAPGNQRLHFIEKPIVLDVNTQSEVYNQLAPVLKQAIEVLPTTPIPITPSLQTVLTDRAVEDKWPLFSMESELKGLIRSAIKDKHAPLPANIPNEAIRERVLDTICDITQEMLESRRDIVVFPVHSGERISINHPNWLTNEILGSLFDPKVRPQLTKAAAIRASKQGAEDTHLLSLQDINAAVKNKLGSTTYSFIPRLLQHVGVCIPVVVDEGGLVRAVAEGADASQVQHWFPAFSTIAMKETDGVVLPNADYKVARRFNLVDPDFCIFPLGYFPSLFVSIVSLYNTASLIKIFKNGMVLRSATDRFQIVVRHTADEKSFVVTVATVGSEPGSDLAFQTIQDIKKFIYSESDWRGNVRVQECGLHPTLLLDGPSIDIKVVEDRMKEGSKEREEHLAFYFGLERGQPLILQKILDELLSVSKAVKQIAQALENFHEKLSTASSALITQLKDQHDVSLEAMHDLAEALELSVCRVEIASVANSQELTKILDLICAGNAALETLPSSDELQLLVSGSLEKPLDQVRAALLNAGEVTDEVLQNTKLEITREVRQMAAEMHRVVGEKQAASDAAHAEVVKETIRDLLKVELKGFSDRDEESRAITAAQVAALLQKLDDSTIQNEELWDEIVALRGSVQAVRSVQTDTVYGVYDIPLLISTMQPPCSGKKGYFERYIYEVYRLHFICPCCGKKAASGPKSHGYKLLMTKAWVAKLTKVVRCSLIVLQILSLFGPIPLPRIADLAQYLPQDMNIDEWKAAYDKTMEPLAELKDLGTELAGELGVDPFEGDVYTDSPPPESNVTGPATTRTVKRPVITLEHVTSVRELLQKLGETSPPSNTGLTRAMCNRTGQCAWVCKGEDGKDSACKTRYRVEGNDCLRIQMVLG